MILSSKMFYGLTKLQARQLAYTFAVGKNKKLPNNWERDQAAGECWLIGFRKRNNSLSLRTPEATSIARAVGFNRPAVELFFNKLQDVFSRCEVPPHRIWNLDETGLSTVQKPQQILAERGSKQLGRIPSVERGVTVTMCCCINAMANTAPPVYIFPRVNYKSFMLTGAPTGSLGLAC